MLKLIPRLILCTSIISIAAYQSARAAETNIPEPNMAVTSNSQFAADLYGQLAKENPGNNLFFSPYSMSSALIMTADGARGETAEQMGKVLGFPETARNLKDGAGYYVWKMDSIHSGMAALNDQFSPKPAPQELRNKIASLQDELEKLNQQADDLRTAGKWQEYYDTAGKAQAIAKELNGLLTKVDQYELRVANALWGEKTYPFEKSYLDTINKYYKTGGAFPMDFRHHFEEARQTINAWVEDQTQKKIKDLIGPKALNDLTRLVLTNAIYFKGQWADPFEAGSTKEEDFALATGTKVRVAMMHKDRMDVAKYAAFNADGSLFPTPVKVPAFGQQVDPKSLYPGLDGFVMLDLPYKGNELSMVVICPQSADSLAMLEKQLSSTNLQGWIEKLGKREVNVYLPKFKLETSYKMSNTLRAMGMVRAFNDPSNPTTGAQFDGMCSSKDPALKLYISEVLHKAFVEVNEKGTEAAAATAVMMAAGCAAPSMVPFTPTFRADKPFIFVIRDVKTGTILFLGRVMNPGK